MKIKYIVPTVGRAKTMTTLDYISKAVALVSTEEAEEYMKAHPNYSKDRFLIAPPGMQGHGKSRALNWMLDTQFDDCDAIIHMDDDVHRYMAHIKNGKDRPLDEEEVYEIFENNCLLAKEWGCAMWGLSINSDPLTYDEFVPFRLHAYIDGGTVGYVKQNELRYDEELTIKEDVDFFLQNIQKYHKALRIDKYWIDKESFTNEGGCQLFRSMEEEKRQFTRMQEKWGSKIIRPNKPTAKKQSKIRGLNGAIRLNLPLEGA